MTERDQPFFVSNIYGEGQTSEPVKADIAELLENMRKGDQPDREKLQTIAENQGLLRMMSLGLLARLSELGAEEASELVIELETADLAEAGLAVDMSLVARHYEDRQAATDDPVELRHLRTMSKLSDALFGLTTVHAVHYVQPDDPSKSQAIFPFAAEKVGDAMPMLSEETGSALNQLLSEARQLVYPETAN